MGIVGPQIYQPKFGPSYRVSYSASIGILCATVLSVFATWVFVAREDRKRLEAASGESGGSDTEAGVEEKTEIPAEAKA